MLEYIFTSCSDTNIIDNHKEEILNEEIANDILQIITVYRMEIKYDYFSSLNHRYEVIIVDV